MGNQPLSNWQGKTIGRYQLTQLLGQGGMGEVWLATDSQLRRQVALKILAPVLASEQEYLHLFAYEARAAALLEHPHILEIHDFGEQQIGQGEVVPYLVMPYVPGGTLRDRLAAARGPLSVQEGLRYLRQAAQAIDYAHSKQIVHRDIKPANMLLRDDWLLLTDFGLAKILNHSTARGQTYAGSGTPEYMAPEQIMGQAQPASDRYSLAVVAYQLLTGRQPFHGATPSETLSMQLRAPLPPPRRLNSRLSPPVESLLIQALARDPALRPPSCLALVDALQQAEAQSDPDATLLAPGSKRVPGSASTSMPGDGADRSGVPSAFSPALPLPQAGGGAPVRQTPEQFAQGYHTRTDPASGPQPQGTSTFPVAISTGMVPGQTFSTQTAPPLTPPAPEKKLGRRTILIGGTVAGLVVIGGGVFALEELRLHSSAPQAGPRAKSTSLLGPKKLIPGIPVLKLAGHTNEVWTASWDPSGRYLLTAGKDGALLLWDVATALQSSVANQVLSTPKRMWSVAGIKFANITDAVCWSNDGQKIVVGNSLSSKVYVLDASGSTSTPTIYSDADAASAGTLVAYNNVAPGPSNDHFTVVNSGSSGSQAQVWRFDKLDAPEINYNTTQMIGSLRWSRDGSMLAAFGVNLDSEVNSVVLWQSTDRAHPQFFSLPQRDRHLTFFSLVNTLAWSPVDPHLLLVSDADIALLYDVRQRKPVLAMGAQGVASTPVIGKLSWSPNGRYVAASYDLPGDRAQAAINPRISVWDIQTLLQAGPSTVTQQPALTFNSSGGALQQTGSITDLNWSPDGRYIATASLDKTVLVWKVDGG